MHLKDTSNTLFFTFCSIKTLLISHREIETKMTMRYCYTPTRMAEVRKSTIPRAIMK